MRRGLLTAVLVLATATSAPAATVTGPHEIVESTLTTKRPATTTGTHYTARYHAAGDPSADPPYMERMITYNPAGFRFDTNVPERCTGSDLELVLRGPDACPAGSRIGTGTADGRFLGFPPTTLDVDVFNNTNEQIIVARSPLFATVARGTIHPDGAIEFATPTCYPALTSSRSGCAVDTTVQLGSDIEFPPLAGYLTTPPTCPRSRRWETPIRFWWSDGAVDTVVVEHPCRRR